MTENNTSRVMRESNAQQSARDSEEGEGEENVSGDGIEERRVHGKFKSWKMWPPIHRYCSRPLP